MLIEAARRAEAAVKEMLACATEGAASCSELLEGLEVSKVIDGVNAAFQVSAAAAVAGRERHGDGGAEVLAARAGLSRHEARSQVKTAETLRGTPRLRDAVAGGRVSTANAKRLAEAVDKTSAADVASDRELLAKAETMRPEDFAKEARRWATDRQGDGGAADYARQRSRRRLRMWDGDDGMVHLYGEFDAVTGKRIHNRLEADARRMYDGDKKNAANGGGANGNAANGVGERRTFHQCMADALDNLTSSPGEASAGGTSFADICVVAHVDDATGELVAELPDGARLPSEVLEQLACNAKFTGLVYDRDGKPIWRTHSVRTATKAQRQILFARYGGCFHCAAHPALCQIHHIKPVSEGGSTRLDNMVPVCWDCHNRIHHHKWRIRTTNGTHTMHPPDPATHGPARARDPAPPGHRTAQHPQPAHNPNPPRHDRTDHADDDRPAQAGHRIAQHPQPAHSPNPPRHDGIEEVDDGRPAQPADNSPSRLFALA